MIALHWATAILVVTAYFLSKGGPHVRFNPPTWHFITGFAVLMLVLLRILARRHGTPPQELTGNALIDKGARWGHAILYALLIAVPITGWFAASRLGVSLSLFGIPVPALTQPVEGWPDPIADLHGWGGNAILILAGLHALMALWHQFIRRDNTLRRMSPL
jgi:cytochrome b561